MARIARPDEPDTTGTERASTPDDTTATTPDADASGAATTADDTTDSPAAGRGDRATRQAALWATVVALPLTLIVGVLVFGQLRPDPPAPTPSASATAARPQSSAPVRMVAPELAERPATVCRALLSQLPATVRGLNQRPVTAGAEQNAAYGDPAITLACGAAAPTVPPDVELFVVNGVCWLPEQAAGSLALTTVDREVSVRLTVPAGQSQTVEWAAPVSESIVASVPSLPQVPGGCR
ncbi:DUF3515 domain-containing protein [Plantactinospora sonchi]|uniref:DUF3515 domain-containing protein n=1 Tax=Plantactinospora sonchi TaxID=1544735 RepID=A0ABU7RWJ4_9ACTN